MYRHLVRLEQRLNLVCSYNKLAANRGFSSNNGSKNDKPNDDSTNSNAKDNENEKKSSRPSTSAVDVKLNSNTEVAQKKQTAQSKIETLFKSAKNIESIGPNDKQTVSQSIGKPKTFIRQSARSKSETAKVIADETEPIENLARGLDKRLVDAARRVASKMPKHIAKATEKELIDSIEKQKSATQRAKKQFETNRNVKEDFTKSISYQIMKESRKFSRSDETLAELNQRMASTVEKIKLPPRGQSLNQRKFPVGQKFRKDTSLFSGECLNIFDPKGLFLNSNISRNLFWEKLHRDDIELSVDFPPANPFEEMVKLTKEGKLWQYPINNEQGLEAEGEVPFYEHVLLDNLLEGFPDRGPVRQFMELIVMGLSHNPYITVERKHEIISFYKNFFEEKNLLNLEISEETTTENESTL